jgi:hypothetical protein
MSPFDYAREHYRIMRPTVVRPRGLLCQHHRGSAW